MGELKAQEIIRLLKLEPHPEGGHFRETFRDQNDEASTAIYYLLQEGECSKWHRVHGSSEVWHYYAGGALELTLSDDGHETISHRLGADLAKAERPQAVVPAGCWQSAETLGRWTLVGCTVAPGFTFENFEMAPSGWEPG